MGKYDNVTAKEYFEKKKEMLNDLGRIRGYCSGVDCCDCPLHSFEYNCEELEFGHLDKILEIVMEYEPKVDWSKIAVDTKVLVRDSEEYEWVPKYFAKYENGLVYTFLGGKTSFTDNGNNDIIDWRYAKLYEGD